MDAIFNNPFRVLGLSTTASDKEIAKRVSDLLIYAEMGKKVIYETDLPFLGEIDRSAQSVKNAVQKIELPENRIFYSLLWFDLEDSSSKKSIEFLQQDNYQSSYQLLKNEIDNIRPIVYYSFRGENSIDLTKKIRNADNNNYGVQRILNQNGIGYQTQLTIKNNEGYIDIQEGYYEFDFTNKYQIICRFKWIQLQSQYEESIMLGFANNLNERYFIQFLQKGVIRFFKSSHLEFEKEIDKSILFEYKYNRITIQKYDNRIEVIVNENTLLLIENKELFKYSFLCFSGKQKVLIESLSISTLQRKDFSSDIINNEIFPYTKNYSIICLIQTIKRIRLESNLLSYFSIISNLFKQPYFITYTQKIVSNNYVCNFEKLTDIFVQEFYLSQDSLINLKWEYGKIYFFSSFSHLSEQAFTKVKKLAIGSRSQVLLNLINDISERRILEPKNTYDLACTLRNDAVYFFNWLIEFGFGILEGRSISDKVGVEIVECAISHYNTINIKSIELKSRSLKLLTWASDFAFNQQLRDRINQNISLLLKDYLIANYQIIDFELKDRTRSYKTFIQEEPVLEAKLNNTLSQEQNATKVKIENSTNPQRNKTEKKFRSDRNYDLLLEKLRKSGQVLKALVVFLIKYFIIIIIAGIVLFLIFTHKSEKPSKWAGNTLENGSSPYDSYFGNGIFDYNSKSWIKFKNGNSTDVIVCLENVYTGTTIRNEYIRVGSDYSMSNLPVGVYKIKVFYGKDWNPEKSMKNGSIRGAFDSDSNFSVSDDPKDLVNISTTTTYDGISYSTYEITLYTVSNGNMNQRNINSEDFFK